MTFQSRRLFIDNLPEVFTKSDLEKKFNEYGNVSSVDIKQRKNAVDSQTPHFAYVHLSIDSGSLNNCFQDFYNKEWNGHWITVQEAKENFLDRLKREREESKTNNSTEILQIQNKEPQNNFKRRHNTILTEALDNEFNDSIDTQDVEPQANFKKYREEFVNTTALENNCNEESSICTSNDYIIKSNKYKTLPKILKIESVGKDPVAIIDNSKKVKTSLDTDAEKKRVQSLANMRKEYQQKKLIIKNALSKVDKLGNNKIIFDDAYTDEVYSKTNGSENTIKYSEQLEKKVPLFENNESDEEDYNFEVRQQYEGKKGQKLLELQSKFKNDKRFVMDSRFREEESEEENDTNEQELTMEHEKQKEFEILEGVLGHKVNKPTVNKHKMMVRFDPSAPQHAKYEVKYDEKPIKKRKREVENVKEQTEVEEKLPEVSKETFYKVTHDFQNILEEKQEFSLANMFSQELEKVDEKGVLEVEEPIEIKNQKLKETNPFKYDSSDNESELDAGDTETPATTTENKKIWSEPFFFCESDYRFDEGENFLKRLQIQDSSNFVQTRRNLKEVVKAKVKNNQRNNRPFKRKLGGKKRIKVKKAFKR